MKSAENEFVLRITSNEAVADFGKCVGEKVDSAAVVNPNAAVDVFFDGDFDVFVSSAVDGDRFEFGFEIERHGCFV